MNTENSDKGKVTTWKILLLKSCRIWDFRSEYCIPEIENLAFHLPRVYILGVVVFQVKNMTCLWVNTIILTENSHAIMQKDVRYLVNKFTHNTSLVVNMFLCRELRFSTLTNWNHPPYLWHNFIIIYLMKVIRMLALLRHIFVLFLNFFLQKKWYLHTWQPCGITQMVAQSSIIVHKLFIYYRVLIYNFLLLLTDQ